MRVMKASFGIDHSIMGLVLKLVGYWIKRSSGYHGNYAQ